MADNLTDRARAIIEDFCGEGTIALPQVRESIERSLPADSAAAVDLAIDVLSAFVGNERFRVHRGPALGGQPVVATAADERLLIEDRGAYCYGDGGEVRTWFSLDCLRAR